MPQSLIVVACLAAAWIALAWNGGRRRDRLAARLAREWGGAVPSSWWDERQASERWRASDPPSDGPSAVDERTWADLELDRVLARIDRTFTALGSQRLYWRLRSGAEWTASRKPEALVTRLREDPSFRSAVGIQLATAGRSLGSGLWPIVRRETVRTRWWYWSFPVLALLMLGSVAAIAVTPRAILVAAAVGALNMVVRATTALQVPGILAPMRQIGPLLRTARRLIPLAGDSYDGPLSITEEVARLRPLQQIAGWVSRDPVESGELLAGLWEYLNLLFALDANALLFGGRYLLTLEPVLGRVASWIGDVDAAYAVASLRAEPRPWCAPETSTGGTTTVTAVWHPLLDSPVPNDAELIPGRGQVLTGANMSGKSTYLRTIGIAAVLARAIHTCPAAAWRGQIVRVRTLMGRSDDLSAGKSYYQAEADRVVELLGDARSPAPTLFLLDELLRGTNTVERLAAGEAVLNALLAGPEGPSPHSVIVATHDGELVAMLGDRYAPFHFRESVTAEGLHFDFRRHKGPARTRTAIALLAATGAPPGLIAAARLRAEELDRVRDGGRGPA